MGLSFARVGEVDVAVVSIVVLIIRALLVWELY